MAPDKSPPSRIGIVEKKQIRLHSATAEVFRCVTCVHQPCGHIGQFYRERTPLAKWDRAPDTVRRAVNVGLWFDSETEVFVHVVEQVPGSVLADLHLWEMRPRWTLQREPFGAIDPRAEGLLSLRQELQVYVDGADDLNPCRSEYHQPPPEWAQRNLARTASRETLERRDALRRITHGLCLACCDAASLDS